VNKNIKHFAALPALAVVIGASSNMLRNPAMEVRIAAMVAISGALVMTMSIVWAAIKSKR